MHNSIIDIVKQLPFVRLVVPFVLGITCQLKCRFPANDIILFASILFTIYFIYKILNSYNLFRFRYIPGLFFHLFIFLSGISLLYVNTPESFRHYNKKLIAEAIVCDELQEKQNSYKTCLHITKVNYNGQPETGFSNILVYFEKSDNSKFITYGDRIIFEGVVNEISNSGNPGEFDYQQYMLNKGIVGQIYLKSNSFNIIGRNEGNKIFALAYRLRNTLSDIYINNGIEGRELSVLKALSLGDQSDIDPETKQSYAYSGATHILSVSGLHVGIIYVLFNFFLKYFERLKTKRYRYGLWIKVIILLAILWGFAMLSGLSPSVKRAALMFSFVVLGQAGNRYVNIYNSLAASAFVLLIINPYDLTDIGFQLSYIAVISIVFFQPVINRLFTIKNRLLYYIWSLTAVSIAAQIGTFPVTLYYFHMFPNYFILTNLLVIPLSTGILYLSVLMPVFSFSSIISKYIGVVLKYLVYGLNDSINMIERIPFSYSNHIRFNSFDVAFVYILIVLMSVFLIRKSTRYFVYVLLVSVMWISWSSFEKICESGKKEIIVYNIHGETALNVIGDKNYLIADSGIFEQNKLKYGALPYWVCRGKSDYEYHNIHQSEYENEEISIFHDFIQFEDRTIVLVHEAFDPDMKSAIPIKTDYVVVSQDANIDLKKLSEVFQFKAIVFDASNSYYYTLAMKEQCNDMKFKSFFVSIEGAFHERLP